MWHDGALPIVSIFLIALPLLGLWLCFAQKFPNRSHFGIFIQEISHIPLAVVHHQQIILISVNRLHTIKHRTFHCRTQGKPCVL